MRKAPGSQQARTRFAIAKPQIQTSVFRRAAAVLPLLAFSAFLPFCGFAQDYRSGEYELKAAILVNLVRFVDWPPAAYSNPQTPTGLCTLGRDPFGTALDEYSGNPVNGRPLAIRRLQRGDDPRGCQLIYISSSERNLLAHILQSLQGGFILTVGEMEQFAARGGMIQLTVEDKQVHFTINLGAASREQLRIRSNLLALSHVINNDATQTYGMALTRFARLAAVQNGPELACLTMKTIPTCVGTHWERGPF